MRSSNDCDHDPAHPATPPTARDCGTRMPILTWDIGCGSIALRLDR